MVILSGFEEENFVNYHKPSMTIGFPSCDFKCGKWCQNYELKNSKRISVDENELVKRYLTNGITHAIVCAGLEPFDSFEMLLTVIKKFRDATDDDIVIYTGYNEDEILQYVAQLKHFKNIIIKYGRYISDAEHIHDDVLGIDLASPNQYAVRIS